MKKFSFSNVTAGMLSKNFKKIAETLVASDKAFVFTNTIKGASAFWERFQLEVLQWLGSYDAQKFLWHYHVQIYIFIANIFKIKRQKNCAENKTSMSYFQKCEILNESIVFAARHFQYRLEVFFTEILMGSDLLGKIRYYAIRVEFQFLGSPHIHSFL